MLRMKQSTFRHLCTDLESNYGLLPSRNISTLEKIGLFVRILSKGASNRDVQEQFSSETVCRVFKEVLNVMDGFSRDIIKLRDPKFNEVPT